MGDLVISKFACYINGANTLKFWRVPIISPFLKSLQKLHQISNLSQLMIENSGIFIVSNLSRGQQTMCLEQSSAIQLPGLLHEPGRNGSDKFLNESKRDYGDLIEKADHVSLSKSTLVS